MKGHTMGRGWHYASAAMFAFFAAAIIGFEMAAPSAVDLLRGAMFAAGAFAVFMAVGHLIRAVSRPSSRQKSRGRGA